MRQERAFSALSAFLRSQQASGARIVLVVTGKGREGSEGRGVLRESVPHWLAGGKLRPFVVGFEEAHRRHGGGGALYVRIRRRRAAGRLPAERIDGVAARVGAVIVDVARSDRRDRKHHQHVRGPELPVDDRAVADHRAEAEVALDERRQRAKRRARVDL